MLCALVAAAQPALLVLVWRGECGKKKKEKKKKTGHWPWPPLCWKQARAEPVISPSPSTRLC